MTSQESVCKEGYYPLPSLRISSSYPTPETKNSPQNKTQQNVTNKHKRIIKQSFIDLVGKSGSTQVSLFVHLVELMILKSRVKLALSTNYTPLSCFSYLFQTRFSYSSSSHARDSFQPTKKEEAKTENFKRCHEERKT